jgi:hypothetical protein
LYNAWTQNLQTEEEKERFKSALIGAEPILKRLNELLEIKERDIDRVERSQKAYENPNWAYLQAHRNGYLTAIQAIKNLVTPDQENK